MVRITTYLVRIKNFIEKKIKEEDYFLAKEPEQYEEGMEIDYVQPKVAYGHIAHENFAYALEEIYKTPPYVLVGTEECTFDEESETIPISIQVCVFSEQDYEENEETKGMTIPDNLALIDAYDFLETLKKWLTEDADFEITKPFKIGIDGSNTYPYAFGHINFEIQTNEGTTRMFEDE